MNDDEINKHINSYPDNAPPEPAIKSIPGAIDAGYSIGRMAQEWVINEQQKIINKLIKVVEYYADKSNYSEDMFQGPTGFFTQLDGDIEEPEPLKYYSGLRARKILEDDLVKKYTN